MDHLALDQQSYTALAALNHLISKVQDEATALDSIEYIADAIDVVVDLVEANKMSDETGKAAAVDYLLKMLKSPCAEVVKLSLAGLDRLMNRREVAVYSGRIGAFEVLASVLISATGGDKDYERYKASDVLAFLLAPQDNKFLKTVALRHPIFEEHVKMILSGHEKFLERGLQFLWCLTDNFKDAQEKVMNRPELFPVILKAIADADSGRNALRLLNNLSKLDDAKKKLPVTQITNMVRPIMRIPDKVISKKDKAITALTVANLLESGTPVDRVIVEYLRDIVGEVLAGSFITSKVGLKEIFACYNGLASKEENKATLAECGVISVIIQLLRLDSNPHVPDVNYLKNVKEVAAKTLWYMAYNENVRKQMRSEGLIDTLNSLLAAATDEKIKKSIKDILWIFELKDANEKMSNLKTSTTLRGISSPPSSPMFSPSGTQRAESSTPDGARGGISSPATTYAVPQRSSPLAAGATTQTTYSPTPTSSVTTLKFTPAPATSTPATPPPKFATPTYVAPVAKTTTAPVPVASVPSASTSTSAGNKPKWMVSSSATATAAPTPAPAATVKVTSTPPLSSSKPAALSSMDNKPKWFVSAKK